MDENESVPAEDIKDGEEKPKAEKPKRTPEEELRYFEGRAKRIRKELGLDEPQETPAPKKEIKESSDELDNGSRALWRTYAQIEGMEEWALIRQEMKRSGITDPEELSQNPYFKQKLEALRTTKANADAANTSTNRTGQTIGKDSAEYWVKKLRADEEVPADLPRKLRTEIVQARMRANREDKMFYND